MKPKLISFENFAESILPHEIAYLMDQNQINDPERLNVLGQIAQKYSLPNASISFDKGIDKRKYSHLKNWITQKLEKIDVDHFHSWLHDLDQKIMQDAIAPEEERQLLKMIIQYDHCHFYFTKLYETLQNYSHFLLVRLRLNEYEVVNQFLSEYEYAYKYNKLADENLHKASSQIVKIYASGSKQKTGWRKWLTEVLYNDQIQGYLRYLALIRLHFCALCDNDYEGLQEHYEYMDAFFAEGKFYSKRILVNYYFNRMLLHSKNEDYARANYYGRLSIKIKTHDYLLYCNNLSSTLIKQERFEDAIEILKGANKEYKDSNNFYHKTDYVSFFIECLIGIGERKSAYDYGMSFYKAYRKEIFESRWHVFFTTLVKCLYMNQKYNEVLHLIHIEKLLSKEEALSGSSKKVSLITYYHDLSAQQI
jgi:hypothetical protein